MALKEKKGKENFEKSVRHCLLDEVVTLVRVRKFGRRARQYLIAYHALEDSPEIDEATRQDCAKFGPVSMDKLLQRFKTHCCAMDFDYKFIINLE